MIPRYQRILFWSLVAGIFLMAAFLLHGCAQAHKRLTALNDDTPIAAPTSTNIEDVALYVANDADASIAPVQQQIGLPQEPTARLRVLLDRLLADDALPASAHPLKKGPAVDDVFLLNLPLASTPGAAPSSDSVPGFDAGDAQEDRLSLVHGSGQLAVVNLHGSFADGHPSGIEVEDLTLLSIIGTLHAALPQVTLIRFLVDGQHRETLAGHADLQRTYLAADTTTRPAPPVVPADATASVSSSLPADVPADRLLHVAPKVSKSPHTLSRPQPDSGPNP